MQPATVGAVAWPARLLALAAAMMLAFALLPLASADADEVTAARAEGATRIHTAATIATLTFDQADVVHLAYSENFPDALAASFGAGSVNGPILLSESDEVHEATLAALAELETQEVRLVGGTAVLSEAIESQLEDAGYDVDRISGVDRFQTASSVAMRYGTEVGVGEVDGQRAAFLASGADFPDALAVGPVAAALGLPLFLTPPDTTEFSVNTSLEQLDIERIIVAGGTAAVSASVVEHYQDAGYEVERWSGPTRTETAQVVADNAIERLGFSPELTLLARGDAFPDALAASAHGAANLAPLLLAETPAELNASTRDWFAQHCPDISTIRAIGGTAAVSDAALDEAVSAAERCMEPEGLVGTPSGDDRQSDEFPGPGDTAQLVEVRAAAHDGFDRVVFEFDGPDHPGWLTEMGVPPATAAGSGLPVDVEGEAYLGITMAHAVAQWAGGAYDGPDRIAVDGGIVTEIVMTGDFEGHLTWAIGLEQESVYAIGLIDNPTRIVIDVVHELQQPTS